MIQILEQYLDHRGDDLGTESRGQVQQAIALFVHQNGDLSFDDVRQVHLGSFVTLMDKLPSRYGRTRAELDGGLAASVARGTAMKANGEGPVGLSQRTKVKHLTWLQQVFDYADGVLGLSPAEPVSFTKVAPKKAKKRVSALEEKARKAWTADEIRTLFSAPPWTGCADLFERLKPGAEIWHDGWYFIPLGLALQGMRSEEFTGLSLAEVHENAKIPYIELQFTAFRGLKNQPSIRSLPIHPELIRLGFLDYIRAIRKLNFRLVFPEMHSPARTMGFDNVFYKQVFAKLRTYCFPDKVSPKVGVRRGKEKDVHSLRGAFANLLLNDVAQEVREDMLGHAGKSTIRVSYDEPAALSLMLNAIAPLASLTAHIGAHPLHLRPIESLTYGQPRGRKRLAP